MVRQTCTDEEWARYSTAVDVSSDALSDRVAFHRYSGNRLLLPLMG